ncbi:MAG TPA: fibronectin type III domain-containing protein [Candidatus Dormibacteraeota bacterium]
MALALALLLSAAALVLSGDASHYASARVATSTPSRLDFGLSNDPSEISWMTSSGVPWRYRYQYLAGGVNTGAGWETWNSPSGAFATLFMNDSDNHGYFPVFTYYELLQSTPSIGGDELTRDYNNLNNAGTMRAYYTNFALLMTKAKAFAKPVIVHIEPDLFAYMEHKAGGLDASKVSASVTSSGYAGVRGLPNTFQGFAWALLSLRDGIAPNVILATHASTWASGVDIGLNTDPTFNMAADADKVAAFLGSAGVSSNTHASTFDLVFNDVSDNDAGINTHWWDRTDATLPNFQQWLTWMTELRAQTMRPLVVWQVPVGNQYFDTMDQSPGHTQDNRAEYFLSHVPALRAAGIIAVLFGSGGNGGSTYTDASGDGVTNPAPVSTFQCNLCNSHASVWSDDDGGYLRIFVGSYYSGTPATAPDAPANVGAIAGEGSALVAWKAPVSDGGSAITSYTVTSSPATAPFTAAAGARSATITGLADGTSYTFTITANNAVGPSAASPASNAVIPGRGAYVPLVPARIMDTRTGAGGVPKASIGPGQTLNIKIAGQVPVPASGVSAVVLNVTATNATASSFLTVWPAGVARPIASNLNWVRGQTVPNLVVVSLGSNGYASLYNGAGSVDVIFDVAGYVAAPTPVPPAAGLYNPIVPHRVLDTRNGTGTPKAQLCAGQTINVPITGTLNVPSSGVSAVVLNVTATNTVVAPSFVTVFPTGSARPLASNLNFVPGQTVANRVIVKVGTGGSVSFYDAAGHTDVVADVAGWFTDGTTAAGGARFLGVTPARILDTRSTTSVGPGATRALTVAGQGGVPAIGDAVPPTAVVLNVTVTNPTASSFLTVWPDGSARPLASDVNFRPGQTVPGLVVVRVGPGGAIDLYNAAGSADVIVDVVGWFG